MADPKSNVQKVIDQLTKLKGHIDAEITRYTTAKENVEDNYRVADNKKEMNTAKKEIQNQVARIDTIIFNNPEIASLIGALGEGEVETLNTTIRDVLAKVEELKSLGMKDVDFKTSTETVVTEVDKIEKINEDVDYDNIGDKVTKMEKQIALEEFYLKYVDTQTALAGKEEVDENYDNFIQNFMQKIKEYKDLEKLKKFSTVDIAKGKVSNKEAKVREFLTLLSAVKGEKEITVKGLNGGKPIAIEKITYEDLEKLNYSVMQRTMKALVEESKVEDSELEGKATEMTNILSTNPTMQKIFTEDRDRIQAILDKKPLNAAGLDSIFEEISKSDGKNHNLLGEMIDFEKVGDVETLKREVARLKGLNKYVEAEEAAKARVKVDDFSKVSIAGKEIELHKGDYDGEFLGIGMDSELKKVTEATYLELEEDTRKALAEEVEKNASRTGDKLPSKLWSGIMSFFTFGAYNPRKSRIETRVKNMISDSVIAKRNGLREVSADRQKTADAATAEREKMTEFDRSLRVTENDLAREKMRQEIIASKGDVTAEKAKSKLNLDQISADARKKVDDEGR